MADTLDVDGILGVGGNATFSNAVTIVDTLDVGGNTTLYGTLSVTGTTDLTGAVTMANTLDVDGTLGVGGDAETKGGFAVATDAMTTDGVFWNSVDKRLSINRKDPPSKLYVNGDIRASGTVVADSDRRIKTDLTPINGELDKVVRLTGYIYYRHSDKTRDKNKHKYRCHHQGVHHQRPRGVGATGGVLSGKNSRDEEHEKNGSWAAHTIGASWAPW